jgi:hypothetical protein
MRGHPVESQQFVPLRRCSFSSDHQSTYRITNNADGIASRQSSQTDTETASQVHETVEQTVLHLRRRLHVSGNENCNHQGIHSNNTRHDDWDKRLWLLAFVRHVRHLRGLASLCLRTFMMRSDLKVPTPAIPMPDFAVPYAAPMPVPLLSSCIFGPSGSRLL